MGNPAPDDQTAATSLPNATATLRDWQSYIWQMNIKRGFNLEDPSKKFVMLMEEMGELAKAVRQTAGMKFTDTTTQTEVAAELADVQIVLLGLASILNIDMTTAVIAKEQHNRQRTWK